MDTEMGEYRRRAQELYDQMTLAREGWEKIGVAPRGAMAATVDEIENHLRLVDEVAQQYDVRLDPDKVEFGASREALEQIADGKARQRRRSAGARALSRKYGKAAAEDIIYRKTGRRVSLKR